MKSPLIIPADVTSYTSNTSVQTRPDAKLEMDIIQAVSRVTKIVGHNFSDDIIYPTLPDSVKLALIQYAEYFALLSLSRQGQETKINSETFDDYSYSKQESVIPEPDVMDLLMPYVSEDIGTTKVIRMKLRKL